MCLKIIGGRFSRGAANAENLQIEGWAANEVGQRATAELHERCVAGLRRTLGKRYLGQNAART